MIGTTKLFGQYVLTPSTQIYASELDDVAPSSSSLSYASSCAIPEQWLPLRLVRVSRYNHDTSIFTFCLPEGHSQLALPLGAHLLVLAPGREHGGGDAIRPYTSILEEEEGVFALLVKRYDEWGAKETPSTHFLFTRTNHTYRPKGAVSNYIHSLKIGDELHFKHTAMCLGRLNQDTLSSLTQLTLIAVGVGVAPMIQLLRALFEDKDEAATVEAEDEGKAKVTIISRAQRRQIQVVLLYGAREVEDILLREQLEAWQEQQAHRFKLVFCIGSRFANVHMGAKTKDAYVPPPPPKAATRGTRASDRPPSHSFGKHRGQE